VNVLQLRLRSAEGREPPGAFPLNERTEAFMNECGTLFYSGQLPCFLEQLVIKV
jgi:hypothetical protein